jgi:hypothetical protein
LLFFCLIGFSGKYSPTGGDEPNSSVNSRFAASSGSSKSSNSPFGIVHAPSSLLSQNGPPGWTRRTSIPEPFGTSRYKSNPALFLGISALTVPQPQSHNRARSKNIAADLEPGRDLLIVLKLQLTHTHSERCTAAHHQPRANHSANAAQ